MNILLVEDSEDDTTWAEFVFARAGWKATTASTLGQARKCLSCAREDCASFDLVLLDLNLPDGRGVEGVERLKGYQVPILVCTGEDDPDLVDSALNAGAFGYFVKGSGPADLLRACSVSLQLAQSARRKKGQIAKSLSKLEDAVRSLRTIAEENDGEDNDA